MSQFAEIFPEKFLRYALVQRSPNAQHNDSTGPQGDLKGGLRRGSRNMKSHIFHGESLCVLRKFHPSSQPFLLWSGSWEAAYYAIEFLEFSL